jgi:hypothetical protein
MLFHGCAIIRVLNCNGHGNNGWWSIREHLGKVVEFGQRKWAEKIKVVWYWPSMRVGVQMELGCSRIWYTNCMEASWKPSLDETWLGCQGSNNILLGGCASKNKKRAYT